MLRKIHGVPTYKNRVCTLHALRTSNLLLKRYILQFDSF